MIVVCLLCYWNALIVVVFEHRLQTSGGMVILEITKKRISLSR
jgi:hypothetical protein